MSACRGSTQITGGGDGGSRRPSRVPCLERDERAGAVDHLEIRKRVLQFAGDHCLHRFDPEPTATRKLPEFVDDSPRTAPSAYSNAATDVRTTAVPPIADP